MPVSTRGLRAIVALAAFVTVLAPVSTPGSQAAPRCADEARRVRPDGWTSIRRPAYSVGPGDLRAWAASPFVDGFLLATNGDAIARSTDGGCSWEETYTPGTAFGEARVLPGENTIRDLAMPPSPPGRLGYTVYAVVNDVDGTRVMTSDTLGVRWDAKPSVGLPTLHSEIRGLWVSPTPSTAFVLVDSVSSLTSIVETTLYVTRDAGNTFAPVTRGLAPRQYTQIALDPIDARSVWAWDVGTLFHSTDGGASFSAIDVQGPIGVVDVLHYPAFLPARVVVYNLTSPTALVSSDGGASWRSETTPGIVTGTSNLYSADALAMASDKGVHLRAPGLLPQSLTNVSPKARIKEVAFSRSPLDITLYGRAGSELYLRRFTYQLKVVKPPKLPPLPPVDLRGGAPIKIGPTTLKPAKHTVRVRPGQRAKVEYQLDLAPAPTPLDVFFATDSTGSMAPVIASLRQDLQDIIDDLGESGIDVWFGVGDFKDYPTHGTALDYPYKRHRAVGPIDDELAAAIENISVGGGNGLDSALAATYQAATGLGQERVEGHKEAGHWIDPGQGAEWREDALKVLVIAADVTSRDPQTDPGYPGPSYSKVISALNRGNIEHVGLAVGDSPDQPRQSLARVSRGTGTVAPPGGIDCDDDGEIDLAEGEPLVCELPVDDENGTALAPAVVGLLRSLRDLQPVAMTVNGDRRVARIASAPVFGEVNVKQPNRLPFTVEVGCDVDTAGRSFPVAVRTKVGSRVVASASLTVECESLPVEPPHAPPPAAAVVAALAPLAPPPPPAPIPQVQAQPNPNPNPNPNPQPAANAQAGAAHQDQAEVQLALAYNDVTDAAAGEQLAMVGLAVGALMAAACAVAFARRERPALARATVRPRRYE
jgi:hypothetical protein